ncbi:MAG: hypothetical protein AB1589_44615 [Cyanobacteriota bacterium]
MPIQLKHRSSSSVVSEGRETRISVTGLKYASRKPFSTFVVPSELIDGERSLYYPKRTQIHVCCKGSVNPLKTLKNLFTHHRVQVLAIALVLFASSAI